MSNNVFETLNGINVNGHTEVLKVGDKKFTYLSWTWAWAELKKAYPDATYNIHKFGENRLPYVYDPNTGYMVFTDVTINGQTYEMFMPVLDGANKAMKDKPYTYEVKFKNTKIEKTVNAATMFDINKAIMRCLVKNLAMFGLGLYIYAGDDLPEPEHQANEEEKALKSKIKQRIKDFYVKENIAVKDVFNTLEMIYGKADTWDIEKLKEIHDNLDEIFKEEVDRKNMCKSEAEILLEQH